MRPKCQGAVLQPRTRFGQSREENGYSAVQCYFSSLRHTVLVMKTGKSSGKQSDPDPEPGLRVDWQRFNGGWPQRGPVIRGR